MRLCLLAAAFLAALLNVSTAPAVRIETRYIEAGERIPSVGIAGERPASAVGGGDLATIVRAAADVWESLIADEHTLTLSFGWYDTTGVSNSAFHAPGQSGGTPQRQITGSLAFNNADDAYAMFLDPTPHVGEEFALIERAFGDYGSGPIEDTRRFGALSDDARGRNDLFTAALHEIGHALGLTRLNSLMIDRLDGDIDVTLPGFSGTEIPLEANHLATPSALLSAQPRRIGERRGVTQLDLLAVCQVSAFEACATGLTAADYAGDLNGDGATNAADYTLLRDAITENQPEALRSTISDDSARQLWSDSFGRTFTTQSTLSGDFNADGRIDAADYTLWRDGLDAIDYRADGNADGRLDQADREAWAAAYGGAEQAAAGAPASTPEPAAWLLATSVVGAAALGRQRR